MHKADSIFLTKNDSEYLKFLKEHKIYCLNNFCCALEQIFNSKPGTTKNKKGRGWLLQILKSLNEIENLIEKTERATHDDRPS